MQMRWEKERKTFVFQVVASRRVLLDPPPMAAQLNLVYTSSTPPSINVHLTEDVAVAGGCW